MHDLERGIFCIIISKCHQSTLGNNVVSGLECPNAAVRIMIVQVQYSLLPQLEFNCLVSQVTERLTSEFFHIALQIVIILI